MTSRKASEHTAQQNRRQFLKTSSLALAGAALAKSFSLAPRAAAATPSPGSPNSRIGIGLIGTGHRCNQLLAECLPKHEAWQIDFPAVCDVWSVNAESTAAKIEKTTGRKPKSFSRYQDVLAMNEVDCVIIATPDFSHTPILVAAADAGKHVYVEKPMSVSLEQAEAAVEATQRNGTVVQVGTQFRSQGQFIEAAKAIKEGALGRILKVDASYHRPHFAWGRRDTSVVRPEDVDWDAFLMDLPKRPFDPQQLRGWHLYSDYTTGITGLLGSHVIDIAHWLSDSGVPTSGTGVQAWMVQESEIADFQECLFTYENGMILNASCRTGNSAPGSQINFYGTRGTLHCPFSRRATLELGPNGASADDPVEKREFAPVDAQSHLENWFTCVREGSTKTRADIFAGYAHAVAAILATTSASEGRRIDYKPVTT